MNETMSTQRTDDRDPALDPLYAGLRSTTAFAWQHLDAMVAISVGWVLCSLPVVTIGPATLGGYCAIVSLREEGQVSWKALLEVVREQLLYSVLLGTAPVVLLSVTTGYALAYLSTGATVSLGLTVVGLIGSIYVLLISVPTYVGLAHGDNPTEALKGGVFWTAHYAVRASVLATVTVALFVSLALTTIGVGLLFAGLTFALHTELVTATQHRSPSTNDREMAESIDATDNRWSIPPNEDTDQQMETSQ